MQIPGVGIAVEKIVGGIVTIGNDAAQWSVRPEAIHAEYRKVGHAHVNAAPDIAHLDLSDVDRAIGWLGAKYRGLAAAEGAATGVVGLPGIPVDVVALVTLNLRAVGEYATYCGFDLRSESERLYAMHALGLASSTSDASKTLAMAQLAHIAKDVARKKVWKDLEKHGFVRIVRKIAESLGIRLTKAKLAQIVPYAGAGVGAGFNAYYTNKVCKAAYFLYRERFLAGKYGEDWVGQQVNGCAHRSTSFAQPLQKFGVAHPGQFFHANDAIPCAQQRVPTGWEVPHAQCLQALLDRIAFNPLVRTCHANKGADNCVDIIVSKGHVLWACHTQPSRNLD